MIVVPFVQVRVPNEFFKGISAASELQVGLRFYLPSAGTGDRGLILEKDLATRLKAREDRTQRSVICLDLGRFLRGIRHGRGATEQSFFIEMLRIPKQASFTVLEKFANQEGLIGLMARPFHARRLRRASDYGPESGGERIGFVALIPNKDDPACGFKNALKFLQGCIWLEPVKRLRRENDVHAALGQRCRFG
jgi:hypothetical protein